MKNITLNFYSEKQIIPYKNDFLSLKKSISEYYNLSNSDVDEIEISYNEKGVKKIINNENDYKGFLNSRIHEINLEIKESSKLYKKNLEELLKKNNEDLVKLSLLKKQKDENIKKQEKEGKELKMKLDELHEKIKNLNQQKLDYVKTIKKMMRGTRNKEKELTTKITKLGKEIEAPLIYNLTEANEQPVQGKTDKEKKYLELIKRNTECLKVQEQLYSTPRKNIEVLDMKLKSLNKECFEIIKASQKEMAKLKKEERNLILEIITIQKKLGVEKILKKPMIKTGFYFPDKLQIKPLKRENENKNKNNAEIEIKLKSKNLIIPTQNQKIPKKKITRKMIRRNIRHLKLKTRSKILKTNKRINNIIESTKENNTELTSEEKEFLKKSKLENKKAQKEIDNWMQFILSHTKELISAYEHKNEINIEKLKEIEKRLGNFKKGETLIKPSEGNNFKKEHPGIFCSQCKEKVVGIRYKCVVCEDFNYCEKCESKFMEEHGHPMLKINSPEMNPVSINCSFALDK